VGQKSRGIVPFILNLDSGWRRVVNIILRSLYPVKEPHCPMNRGLGGNHSRLDHSEKKQNFSPPTGFEPRIV
jgi:hypothetical protein